MYVAAVNADLTVSIFENQVLGIDRLSNLPDHLIHHILSLLDTKSAVQKCLLSKHWRHHWTHTHALNFDHSSFRRRRNSFARFIRHVLRRHQPYKLSKLRFVTGGRRNQSLISRILNYAKSHGVEELETDVIHFPPAFLKCETLKTLNLGPHRTIRALPPNSFGFKSLTTLQLTRVFIWLRENDLFSSFLNLENLKLIDCVLLDAAKLDISAPRLVNLRISNLKYDGVITVLVVSAPRLKYFHFDMSTPSLPLYVGDCVALDKIDICLRDPYFYVDYIYAYIQYLMSLAQCFSHENAKSCVLSLIFPQQRIILRRSSPHLPIKVEVLEQDKGLWDIYYPCPMYLKLKGLSGPL
ncbi:hypothetical protein AB3S75_021060 [Citrus x aurantiifolia]